MTNVVMPHPPATTNVTAQNAVSSKRQLMISFIIAAQVPQFTVALTL
jgi:hypothetical protein